VDQPMDVNPKSVQDVSQQTVQDVNRQSVQDVNPQNGYLDVNHPKQDVSHQ